MAVRQPVSFGLYLRRYRLARSLTQEELAERAGLSARGISDLERGINRTPYRETVRRLAEALAVSGEERRAFEGAARGGAVEVEDRVPHSAPTDTPLIGRSAELAVIEQHLRGMGPPALVVAGEPGVGKSRLLREAVTRAAHAGLPVISGGCQRRSGQEPYAPLAGALARTIEGLRPAELRQALHGCAWLVRLLPELTQLISAPLPAGSVPATQERRLLFAAVGRLLANLARPEGILLALDDIQWAHQDGLDLLRTLIESAPTSGLRVIATYRDTEVVAPDPLGALLADLADAGQVRQIPLRPLAPDDATELLDGLLGQDVAKATRDRIVERSGGLPFYLLTWALGSDHESVPWSIEQSIRRRAAVLSDVAAEVLAMAAVAGRSFPRTLLLDACEGAEGEIVGGLEEVYRAGLLIAEGNYTCRFPHDVIREVIEGTLSAARQAQLHRRVADALVRRASSTSGGPEAVSPAEIGWHFLGGESPLQAVPYLHAAGEGAEAVFAHSEAERQFRLAVAAARQIGDQWAEARALEHLGGVLTTLTLLDEALLVMEGAATLYGAAGRVEDEGRMVAQIGWIQFYRGQPEAGTVRLEAMAAVLERTGPSPALGAIYCALTLHLYARRSTEGLAAGERATEIARQLGDDRLLVEADVRRGLALHSVGRADEAVHVLEEIIPRAESMNHLQALTHACGFLADVYGAIGAFGRAIPMMERALTVAKQRGETMEIVYALNGLAQFHFVTGEWGASREYSRQAVTVDRGCETTYFSVDVLLQLVRLDVLQGRTATVEEDVAEIRRMEARLKHPERGGHAELILAEWALVRGCATEAYAHVRQVIPETGDDAHILRLEVEIALALATPDHRARAAHLAGMMRERLQERSSPVLTCEWRWLEGMLAALLGERAQAARLFGEAIERARPIPYPWIEARALLAWGEMGMEGNEPEATGRLRAALLLFERLEAAPLIGRARTLLVARE